MQPPCMCCPRFGSAIPGRSGLMKRNQNHPAPDRLWQGGQGRCRPHTRALGSAISTVKAPPSCFSPRMIPTNSASSAHQIPVPYVKDGIHNAVIHRQSKAVNPEKTGTKLAAHYSLQIEPGQSQVVRLRLSDTAFEKGKPPFGKNFDQLMTARLGEADQFYDVITPDSLE